MKKIVFILFVLVFACKPTKKMEKEIVSNEIGYQISDEGNKSKRSQQINFALTKIKNDTNYSLAFDGSNKQLLKFNISKKLLGFNLGLGSDLSLKENNYNKDKYSNCLK